MAIGKIEAQFNLNGCKIYKVTVSEVWRVQKKLNWKGYNSQYQEDLDFKGFTEVCDLN